uniref:EB domain-containing protein n=1 Tax=Timema douglasi TaxID=61478 RepID=A0A7R8VQI2_TIMDO|nr:unnamed protein product [Timema douglasi]
MAVGESCVIHTDCVYVADCAANRTCICRDTYVTNPSNNTTCLAGVNNSCDYDEDCIDNAFCLKQSHCECMDGRRPTKDRVTCVYTDKIHPTEIRISISPSSAVELNTTSALANYATEAGFCQRPREYLYWTLSFLKLTPSPPKKTKLKSSCATRWVDHHDSVITLQELFPFIAAALAKLEHGHDADTAACFSSAITRDTNCSGVGSLRLSSDSELPQLLYLYEALEKQWKVQKDSPEKQEGYLG